MKKSTVSLLVAVACLLMLNACAKKPAAPEVSLVPAVPVVQPDATAGSTPAGISAEPVADVAGKDAMLKLQKVYFDFDAYTLTSLAREVLARNAEWLRQNPEARLTIEGHCDERGSDEYNLALGQRRAESAKSYLVGLGIAADRLTSISYGEERPAVAGSDEGAWSQNRRAEFK